jgi:hypothetical protein
VIIFYIENNINILLASETCLFGRKFGSQRKIPINRAKVTNNDPFSPFNQYCIVNIVFIQVKFHFVLFNIKVSIFDERKILLF